MNSTNNKWFLFGMTIIHSAEYMSMHSTITVVITYDNHTTSLRAMNTELTEMVIYFNLVSRLYLRACTRPIRKCTKTSFFMHFPFGLSMSMQVKPGNEANVTCTCSHVVSLIVG